MEHYPTEVSYDGDEVVARCACGHEAKAVGAEADAEARAELAKHVEEANA